MTNGKQADTIATLQADVAALTAIVAALQSDACHCTDIARARARKHEHEKRSRFDRIANLPRGERNAAIENFSAVDLEAFWCSIGDESIVRILVEAPSHAAQDQWLALVTDPIAKRRARAHLHKMVERVRVRASADMSSDVGARTIVISREQYDRLVSLGFDVTYIKTERGYLEDNTNPYRSTTREVMRYSLSTLAINKAFRWFGTRELLDALVALDRALAMAIEAGDLVVTTLDEGESRIYQIREDVTRTPDTLRKLERLPVLASEGNS